MHVNIIFEIDKKIDYRKIFIFFEVAHMFKTFGQGKEMTLTFNTHLSSSAQLVVCIYQLSGHWLQ